MLVVVLVYQQVENNILTPKIQGKAVNLSGFFIIVAVTLFGALLGVLGALTAVPLAATIQIFVQELTKARRERVAAAKAALEPAEPAASTVPLPQRVDRCGRDDPLDAPRQLRVQGDERVRLQLRERDVLGVVGRGPSQPIRQIPRPTPEHGVAEEPDRHPPDAGEAVARDVGRDLAPLDGLVQGRQRLGTKERRCEELVPLGTSIPALARWRTAPASTTNLVIGYLSIGGLARHRPSAPPPKPDPPSDAAPSS